MIKNRIISLFLALSCFSFCFSGCIKEKKDVKLGNILVFGDSYSTYEGYIPEGYPTFYHDGVDYTDVNHVDETWWKILERSCGSEVVLNESYSGSTISHTGYAGDCISNSFITRFENLIKTGYFEENKIDTVIILGGLNDFWAKAPLGEVKYGDISVEEQYYFLPALSYFLSLVKSTLPDAEVIFIVEEYIEGDMREGMYEICNKLEITAVTLKEISKESAHPDEKGMKAIANQIIDTLEDNK